MSTDTNPQKQQSTVDTASSGGRLRFPDLPGPARVLIIGGLLFALGRGTYLTASVVFFTQTYSMSIGQVGLALSVAGVAAILASVPAGWLADRHHPRHVAVVLLCCQAGVVAALPFAGSAMSLFGLIVLLGAVDRSTLVVRRALVSHVMGMESRVRIQAYLRSVANVAMSVGTLAAAPVLTLGSRSAFTVLCFGVTACYVLTAVATLRLPSTSKLLAPDGSDPKEDAGAPASAPAFRRITGYVSLGLLNGLLSLHGSILNVALPLWIIGHVDAPRWMIAALIFVNTVLAVAFQVLASRGADDTRGAGRALAVSAVFTALCCLLLAASARLDGFWVFGVLTLAVVALTAGELLQAAGEWGLSFTLAPIRAQGRYIGAFSYGTALQEGFGPIMVVSVAFFAIDSGPLPLGWLILAGILLGGGLLVAPLRRLAESGLCTEGIA